MKQNMFIYTLALMLCFTVNLEQASACYIGPTPTLGITGPSQACGGSTATYCVDPLFAEQGINHGWSVSFGTITSTSASCITVLWDNAVTTLPGRVEVDLGTGFVNAFGQIVNGLIHEFTAFTTVVGNVPEIEGPAVSCRFGVLNNVFELVPAGSTSNVTWSISPTTGVTINGGSAGAVLMFSSAAVVGTVYTLTATGTAVCDGSTFTMSTQTTLSNCSGGFRPGQGPSNAVKDHNSLQTDKVSIYPNPVVSGEQLTLELPYSEEAYEVMLFNSFGQQVRSLQTSDTRLQLETSDLANGTYYLRLSDGVDLKTETIVIQN